MPRQIGLSPAASYYVDSATDDVVIEGAAPGAPIRVPRLRLAEAGEWNWRGVIAAELERARELADVRTGIVELTTNVIQADTITAGVIAGD